MKRLVIAIAFALLPLNALGQGQLNLYCSSPNTAWCQGMANGFERASGTKVAVIQKATGEMLAQVKAELAQPGQKFSRITTGSDCSRRRTVRRSSLKRSEISCSETTTAERQFPSLPTLPTALL